MHTSFLEYSTYTILFLSFSSIIIFKPLFQDKMNIPSIRPLLFHHSCSSPPIPKSDSLHHSLHPPLQWTHSFLNSDSPFLTSGYPLLSSIMSLSLKIYFNIFTVTSIMSSSQSLYHSITPSCFFISLTLCKIDCFPGLLHPSFTLYTLYTLAHLKPLI